MLCATAPTAEPKSSWGHAHQEMLMNHLSPASPKSASTDLAKVTTPGHSSRSSKEGPRQAACHHLQLKHSQVSIQSFMGVVFIKVSKPQPCALHVLPRFL